MADQGNKVKRGIKIFKGGHCSTMVKELTSKLEVIGTNLIRNNFFFKFSEGAK